MKFLVFALCVCAASAASFDNRPFGTFKPYQPVQPAYKAQAQAQVGAKTTYNAGKYVANAPVYTAKPVYNAGQYVARPVAKAVYNAQAVAPATPVKQTYNRVQVIPETPVGNTRIAYEAANVVAATPVVAAKPVYEAAKVVAAAPVVAAEPVFKTAPVVAKTAYVVPKTVYNSGKEVDAAIVRSENTVGAEGFNYVYETSNGIAAHATGSLKNVENTNVLVSEGTYQYPAEDGTLVQVSYVADENGFQPRSDILPVGPAIPEAILRSLEYIRTHPAAPEKKY